MSSIYLQEELLYELRPRHACGVDPQELEVLHEVARGEPGHDMPLVLAELLEELHSFDGVGICNK